MPLAISTVRIRRHREGRSRFVQSTQKLAGTVERPLDRAGIGLESVTGAVHDRQDALAELRRARRCQIATLELAEELGEPAGGLAGTGRRLEPLAKSMLDRQPCSHESETRQLCSQVLDGRRTRAAGQAP